MTFLAKIRDARRLSVAGDALSDCLARRQRQAPPHTLVRLVAMWVDLHLSLVLAGREQVVTLPPGRRVEAAEDGLWELFEVDPAVKRAAWLERLSAGAAVDARGKSRGVFVPVYSTATDPSAVRVELRSLVLLHPGRVAPVWLQDRHTGRSRPTAHDESLGALRWG